MTTLLFGLIIISLIAIIGIKIFPRVTQNIDPNESFKNQIRNGINRHYQKDVCQNVFISPLALLFNDDNESFEGGTKLIMVSVLISLAGNEKELNILVNELISEEADGIVRMAIRTLDKKY